MSYTRRRLPSHHANFGAVEVMNCLFKCLTKDVIYRSTLTYRIEHTIQPLQNLWMQLVCTDSRNPKRHIGHSYLLSNGGPKYSSYPSDLGSSCDNKRNSLVNWLTKLGSYEPSRENRQDWFSI